jgi:hypothetical protein
MRATRQWPAIPILIPPYTYPLFHVMAVVSATSECSRVNMLGITVSCYRAAYKITHN